MRMLLIGLALLSATPAAAQLASTPQEQRVLDAVAAMTGAMKESNDALTRAQPVMQAVLANLTSPAAAREAQIKARPLIAELKASIAAASAKLAAIPPVETPAEAGMDVTRIIGELRRQNDATIAVLDACDQLLDAMVRNDRAALGPAARKVATGSVLLVDGQALMMRGRLAGLTTRDSNYQAIALAANLYEAMAAVVRIGFDEGMPAAAQRTLARLAADTRRLAVTGRANVVRESVAWKGQPQLEAMLAIQADTFTLADQIAAGLTRMAAAPLAKPAVGAEVRQMVEFEARYMALAERQAALIR